MYALQVFLQTFQRTPINRFITIGAREKKKGEKKKKKNKVEKWNENVKSSDRLEK